MLASFGVGQVVPLLIAGTFAATVPKLLALRSVGRWVPPISGVVLLSTGLLTLIARLV
jgi:cytochrome c-type biogenesis protein